jgi:hypothetical protein
VFVFRGAFFSSLYVIWANATILLRIFSKLELMNQSGLLSKDELLIELV